MLKKGIMRRITIASLALIILLITYFFPTKKEELHYSQNLIYSELENNVIYALNQDHYVSRISMKLNEEDDINRIKQIINILTIKSNESNYLPTPFQGIIPMGTTLNSVSLEKGLLKLDFSKEFLNTTKELERKMIESIVYSLTELESVNEILIFVDGEELTQLPFSKEKLNQPFNRNFGINQVFDLDSLKNTTKTTIYYGSQENDIFYYIPITYIENNNQEKIEIIIEKLKNAPLYESNLISYLNASAEIKNYEILEDEIRLSFNEYLFDDIAKQKILEEVQYTIYLSIRDTYAIQKVEFLVGNEEQNVNFVINSLE